MIHLVPESLLTTKHALTYLLIIKLVIDTLLQLQMPWRLFLKDSAISFLQFTFRHFKCNKLDKNLFMKLNNPSEIVRLKMDALMFITFTLTLLSWQSQEIWRSLNLTWTYIILNFKVFWSCYKSVQNQSWIVTIVSLSLRCDCLEMIKRFNHRARFKSMLIQRYLFKEAWNETVLYPLLLLELNQWKESWILT